jgi:hypothetical protein
MSDSFQHNLIKGKIAETIFELMFREANEFQVFRYGYEYTEEYLAQHRNQLKFRDILDSISGAPDFLLMKDERGEASAFLVEVKCRTHLDQSDLVAISEKIVEKWDHSLLFVMSSTGFYLSPAHTVINKRGEIERLAASWIPQRIQEKYLALATDFLWNHKHESASGSSSTPAGALGKKHPL